MMLKDIKRREILRKLAPERMKLKSIKSNKILPKAVKVNTGAITNKLIN